MRRASSALRVCNERASSSEKTATVRRPISAAARMTRIAISPRLAIKRLLGVMLLSSLFHDTKCLPNVECFRNEKQDRIDVRIRPRVGVGGRAMGGFGDEPERLPYCDGAEPDTDGTHLSNC